MYKKSPSRNQRSKGVKIKHVLQIFLLLGVCFWLVYQVKHSHDKRKEFDEKDVKVSTITQNDDVIPRLGRKDLPHLDEESNSEKHEDEDEDDGGVEEEIKHLEEQKQEPKKHVEEDQEEENRHGDDDQDEDDNKNEMEEEVRAGGDDEVDEQEKLAGEANHMEELADDDKEREGEDDEKELEENLGRVKEAVEGNNGIQEVSREEIENSVEDENRDVEDTKGHEAREGHYKGDDASSAVSHEPQITSSEVEKLVKENFNILEEEKASGTEASYSENYSSADLKVEEKQSQGGTLLNVTASKFGNESLPNLTKEAELNHQSNNNSTELSAETTSAQLQNGTSLVVLQAQNTTGTSEATGAEFDHPVVASNDSSVSTINQTDVNPMAINKVGHQDLPAQMDNTMKLSDRENRESKTYEEGNNPLENNVSGSQDGSSGTSDSITSGDEGQHDPIDASDLTLPQEERDARVDLGTLPDMNSEVGNNEDVAAE